jgi:hypothetical protein
MTGFTLGDFPLISDFIRGFTAQACGCLIQSQGDF